MTLFCYLYLSSHHGHRQMDETLAGSLFVSNYPLEHASERLTFVSYNVISKIKKAGIAVYTQGDNIFPKIYIGF